MKSTEITQHLKTLWVMLLGQSLEYEIFSEMLTLMSHCKFVSKYPV